MSMTREQATAMLHQHGLRSTPLARQILITLEEMPVPATAKIIHATLDRSAGDLATVHRILVKGAQSGLFRTVRFRDRSHWYDLAINHLHYHHLFCTRCRKIDRLRYCLFDKLSAAAQEEAGFEVQSHSTEIYGLCRNCRSEVKAGAAPSEGAAPEIP